MKYGAYSLKQVCVEYRIHSEDNFSSRGLPVRPFTRVLWQNKRTYCRYFDIPYESSISLVLRLVGNGFLPFWPKMTYSFLQGIFQRKTKPNKLLLLPPLFLCVMSTFEYIFNLNPKNINSQYGTRIGSWIVKFGGKMKGTENVKQETVTK